MGIPVKHHYELRCVLANILIWIVNLSDLKFIKTTIFYFFVDIFGLYKRPLSEEAGTSYSGSWHNENLIYSLLWLAIHNTLIKKTPNSGGIRQFSYR